MTDRLKFAVAMLAVAALFARELAMPNAAIALPIAVAVLFALWWQSVAMTVLLATAASAAEFAAAAVQGSPTWSVEVLPLSAVLLVWIVAGAIAWRQRTERSPLREGRLAAALVDNVPVPMFIRDRDGRYLLANRELRRLRRMQDGDVSKTTVRQLFPPPAAAEMMSIDKNIFETGEVSISERDQPMPDGVERIRLVVKFPIRDATDSVVAVAGMATDITEQRRAERTLREREAQLLQAQKMEAVGQLTGGVAHDFNNLLAVILGNLELAGRELRPGTPAAKFVGNALDAGQRGATLTQRLLAFSRKQALEPRAIDAQQLVSGMSELLRRTLGETIELETVGHGGLWACRADPGQLENAILNLAINSRDAMRRGGKLTIETANARLDDDYAARQAEVTPGQYVQIAVTDTGEGMTPETRQRVFEPFFTTKQVGRGSGLGLSMVYGFVKQSGGHVAIYSEEGEGTTIRMYLPRDPGGAEPAAAEPADDVPTGKGEVVLVVEDDAEVRALVVNMLFDLGYEVLEAADGTAALGQLEAYSRIALLLSDVVLPGGMNGRELASEAAMRRPGLRTLFMSGYTENAIIHHGRLDDNVLLLQKPFRRQELARKVRRALS